MKKPKGGLWLVIMLAGSVSALARDAIMAVATNAFLAMAANGMGIPHPASNKTYRVPDGARAVPVPEGMVYIPAGKFTFGSGDHMAIVELAGYCLGKFPVTNAEYKEFLDANKSQNPPSYWENGNYPAGKANHPVVYVSLEQARAYTVWVSKKTGWKMVIPNRAAVGESGARPASVPLSVGKLTGHPLRQRRADHQVQLQRGDCR